jgi:hypothetical protein
LVLEGRGKIKYSSKGSKTGVLYIAADLMKDSSFPFKPNEEVVVRISEDRLIVERGSGLEAQSH